MFDFIHRQPENEPENESNAAGDRVEKRRVRPDRGVDTIALGGNSTRQLFVHRSAGFLRECSNFFSTDGVLAVHENRQLRRKIGCFNVKNGIF